MTDTLPKVEIEVSLCKGCQLCLDSCKPNVLFLTDHFNGLGYQYVQYKGMGCTGCEACFYACPEPGVIAVVKELKERPKPEGSSK